jgi:LPXTG-motif cell wall-anchored protein
MTKPVAKPPLQQENRLANTGASTGWLVVLGALLTAVGMLLLLLDRTRRGSRS